MKLLLVAILSCVPADSVENGYEDGSALSNAGTAIRIEALRTLPPQSRGLRVSVNGRFARLLSRIELQDGSLEASYFYIADLAANALLVRSPCDPPEPGATYRFVGRMGSTADGQPYLVEDSRLQVDDIQAVAAGTSPGAVMPVPAVLLIGILGGVVLVLAGRAWSFRRRQRQDGVATAERLNETIHDSADAGTARIGSAQRPTRKNGVVEATTPFHAGRQ